MTIHFNATGDPPIGRLADEFWWSCDCGQSAPQKREDIGVTIAEGLLHQEGCRYVAGEVPSES